MLAMDINFELFLPHDGTGNMATVRVIRLYFSISRYDRISLALFIFLEVVRSFLCTSWLPAVPWLFFQF